MKLGDLHNLMMEKDVGKPFSYEYNNQDWQAGFNCGVSVAKQSLSLTAIRYEGYTKKLEQQLALLYSEDYLEAIRKEYLL